MMRRNGIPATALLLLLAVVLGSGCTSRSSRSTLLRRLASAILDHATAQPADQALVASARLQTPVSTAVKSRCPHARPVVAPVVPSSRCVLRCKLPKQHAPGSKIMAAGRLAVLRLIRSIELGTGVAA